MFWVFLVLQFEVFFLKIAEVLVFVYIFIFFVHPDGKVGHEPYIGMAFFKSSKFTSSPLSWASLGLFFEGAHREMVLSIFCFSGSANSQQIHKLKFRTMLRWQQVREELTNRGFTEGPFMGVGLGKVLEEKG